MFIPQWIRFLTDLLMVLSQCVMFMFLVHWVTFFNYMFLHDCLFLTDSVTFQIKLIVFIPDWIRYRRLYV